MPESVTRPEANHKEDARDLLEPGEGQREAPAPPETSGQEASSAGQKEETRTGPGERVIWTPGFLLTFALTLVLGLSGESLLTQGWVDHLFTGSMVIQAHVILTAPGWLILGIRTRSRWIRVGCVFGAVWVILMLLNISLNSQGANPNAPLQSYLNVATCMALLGTYLGLCIEETLLTAWDTWLFLLIPLISAGGAALTYYLTPQASMLTTENALATAALIACCCCWWLRPSCWKLQPGPTFIFGFVPLLLLAMALVNTSMHNYFLLQVTALHISLNANINSFFFAQVAILGLFLGCIRMIQSQESSAQVRKDVDATQ